MGHVEEQKETLKKTGHIKLARKYKKLYEKYKYLEESIKIPKNIGSIKTLKGTIASKGKIRAKARIILDPNKSQTLNFSISFKLIIHKIPNKMTRRLGARH